MGAENSSSGEQFPTLSDFRSLHNVLGILLEVEVGHVPGVEHVDEVQHVLRVMYMMLSVTSWN